MTQLAKSDPDAQASSGAIALFRQATDIAHVCKEIVLKCVVTIVDRRYVKVEGWMSLAVCHGCIASIKTVEQTETGVRVVAILRRQSDLAELSSAEGFVGHDEPDWYGGTVTRYNKKKGQEETKTLEKRADHAIRSMAQTRAISKVLRNGFSHVIVLIDSGLSTVPAEEIASGVDDDRDNDRETDRPSRADRLQKTAAPEKTDASNPPPEKKAPQVPRDDVIALRDQFRDGKWKKVVVHFGEKTKGKRLEELEMKSLAWWVNDWIPKAFGNKPISAEDLNLRAALDVAGEEEKGLPE